MPGVYREKDCLNCGKKFRKKGKFCSQACSNSHREVSDKVRENMRQMAEDNNKTPEGIARQKLFHANINPEDFAIDIPTLYDIPEGYPTDF